MDICWLVQIRFCWMCVKILSQVRWEISVHHLCSVVTVKPVTCLFCLIYFFKKVLSTASSYIHETVVHVKLSCRSEKQYNQNHFSVNPQLHPGPTDIICTTFKSVHFSPCSALVCWASSPLRWSLSWHPLPQEERMFHSSHTLMQGRKRGEGAVKQCLIKK